MGTKTSFTRQELAYPSGSDAALLVRKFKVDDPESLLNLSRVLPNDYEESAIEHWHDVRPESGKLEDRPYVWCAHCQRDTHWKGYVMKASSGARFIIGNDCGEKIYGHEFNLTSRSFDELQTRQHYLFRWKATLEALPIAVDALSEFLKHPILHQYGEAKSVLENDMADLYKLFIKAIQRNDGKLLIDERIRDFEAENRRDSEYASEDDAFKSLQKNIAQAPYKERKENKEKFRAQQSVRGKGEIYKTVSTEIGRISGAEFLKASPHPIKILADCIRDLSSSHTEMNSCETEQHTHQKMSFTLKRVKDLVEKVDAELVKLRSVSEFYQFKNIALIGTWLSKLSDIDSSYKVTGGILIKESTRGKVRAALPVDYKVPMSIHGLEVLRVALARAN